jgi:3-hydroxyacyl-[acyl-carrier-protein] dehydratase
MIQMIRELAEQVTARTLMYSGISNIKFLSVVDPTINSNLIIKLALDPVENGGYSVKASIEFADKTFLSLKGNLSSIKTSSEINFSATDKAQ